MSFASWVLFCAAGFSILYLFVPEYSNYSETLKTEAHQILDIGVNQANSDRAIEILLSEKFGYEPQGFQKTEKSKNPILIRLATLSVLLPLVVLFKPKTTIGLGKNGNKYRVYKWWIKLITITVPLMLIAVPFWDSLGKWLFP